MTFFPVRLSVWALATLCVSPVLAAQSLLYQISVPAVTTGPVQTNATSLQFISPPLVLPVPPVPALGLIQQPNFTASGSAQGNTFLLFASLSGGPNTTLSITHVNPMTNARVLYVFIGSPPPPVYAPGTYVLPGSVSLQGPDGTVTMGSQATATLKITIAPSLPTLLTSAPTLIFKYDGGTLPAPQTLSITSSGDPFSVSAFILTNASWLTLTSPSSPSATAATNKDTTPSSITVTVNPRGLAPGTYTAEIQLNAPGAINFVENIVVTFIVTGTFSTPTPPPILIQISNSASYALSPAPNSAIAQGSLFVIFGINLGPDTLAQSGYPLTPTLAGTSVKVTVGSTSTDALVLYTSTRQVAAILPSRTAVGSGVLVVTYNGSIGQSIPITVSPSSFGTYTVASNGLGPGIITGADYVLKTSSSPARPGETVILWGTGLGAVDGDESIAPTPVSRFSPVVLVGNSAQAKVSYAGRASCCAGLDQINFVVPAGIEGCFVPVSVQAGGVTGNFTSVPIASSGSCVEPPGFTSSLVDSANQGSNMKLGMIAVGAVPVLENFGFFADQPAAQRIAEILGRKVDPADLRALVRAQRGTPAEKRTVIAKMARKYGVRSLSQVRKLQSQLGALLGNDSEGAVALFGGFTGIGSFSNQFLTDFPPSGNCTAFPAFPTAGPGAAASPGGLEAGAQLTISTPSGNKTLSRSTAGEYSTLFGSGFPVSQAPAGTYRVSGSGGKDVGSFSAVLNVSSSLRWVNQSATSIVDRSQPLTVTWSGGPNPGHVVFGGASDTAGGAFFVCIEDAQKGSLTVPQQVLSILPATAGGKGYLFLTTDPFENPFTAPGLDAGYFMNFSNDSREVQFR